MPSRSHKRMKLGVPPHVLAFAIVAVLGETPEAELASSIFHRPVVDTAVKARTLQHARTPTLRDDSRPVGQASTRPIAL